MQMTDIKLNEYKCRWKRAPEGGTSVNGNEMATDLHAFSFTSQRSRGPGRDLFENAEESGILSAYSLSMAWLGASRMTMWIGYDEGKI